MNEDGYKHLVWNDDERIHTGLKLIDIVIKTTGLVKHRVYFSGNRRFSLIEATPKTLTWIQNFNKENEVRNPRYGSTIIPPKKWTSMWGGGYYTNIVNNLPLVRTH